MPVRKLNPKDFNQYVVKSIMPSVVKLYDRDCPLCRGLNTIFSDLADKYAADFNFYKINIQDDMDFSERYMDGGVPTIILFLSSEVPILIEYPAEPDDYSGYGRVYLDNWLKHFKLSIEALINKEKR